MELHYIMQVFKVKYVLILSAIVLIMFFWHLPLFSSPTFKKSQITLDKFKLQVEVADNEELREYGLMGRSSLSDSEGMIFIFPNPQLLRFWMKDTLIPLSIGFFDKEGKLFQITEMTPASPVEVSPVVYPSSKPAKYALEVAKGWFERKKIKLGAKLKF